MVHYAEVNSLLNLTVTIRLLLHIYISILFVAFKCQKKMFCIYLLAFLIIY